MAENEEFTRWLERALTAALPVAYAEVLAQARDIGGKMKAAVPRDKGKLAESIRLETDPQHLRVYIKAGGPATTHHETHGDYDYAMAQEFGTHRAPAHPFFFPTWRLMRKQARSRINRAMKKAIEAASQ